MSESKFWTAARRRFWLVGAILIVLVGVSVLSTFLLASRPSGLPREAGKGELAAYVSDEHKAAFREGTNLKAKFPVTDAAALGPELQNWVGSNRSFEEIFPNGGVKLLGAGKSAVPGTGESAHLRLEPEADGQGLSLFIKQYRQMPRRDEGTYTLPGRGVKIEVWRRGGLLYFLVGETAEGLALLRQATGAPAASAPY